MKSTIALVLTVLLITHATFTAADLNQHRIMCVGDSITESRKKENSWRYKLVQKLNENGYKGKYDMVGRNCGFYGTQDTSWDSDHCGYWGARADQILNGDLPRGKSDHGCIKEWAPTYKPTIVLIHLGTNDSKKGIKPDTILMGIKGIIDHLRMAIPEVKIVVAQILPIGNSNPEKIVQELNGKMPVWAETVSSAQSPLKIVDMHSGMVIGEDQDDLHPNEKGSQKMADKWYTVIKEWLDITAVKNGVAIELPGNHKNLFNPRSMSWIRDTRVDVFHLNGRSITSNNYHSFNLLIIKHHHEHKRHTLLPVR